MNYLGTHHEEVQTLEYENMEQMMEDLPRSTSAPPSLEELQNAYAAGAEDNTFVLVHEDEVAIKPFADIRLDEDYEEFYKVYAGGKKLPPPVENRQVYNMSPTAGTLFNTPFNSAFDADLGMAHHRSHHRRNVSDMTQMDSQKRLAELERRQNSQMLDDHHESGLSAAFARMNFDTAQGSMDRLPPYSSNGGHGNGRNSAGLTGRNGSPDAYDVPGAPRMNGFHPSEKPMGDSSRYGSMGGGIEPAYPDEPVLETSKTESFSHSHRNSRRPTSPYGRSLSVGSRDGLFDSFDAEGNSPLDAYGRHNIPSGFSPPSHSADMYNPVAGGSRNQGHISQSEYEMATLKQAQRAQQHLAALHLQRHQQQQDQLAQLEQDRLRAQVQQQQQMIMMMMMQQQDPRGGAASGGGPGGLRFNPGNPARSSRPPQGGHRHTRSSVSFQNLEKDLMLPPPLAPSQQPLVGVCPFYLQGYCARGATCPFMHSIPPLANMPAGDRAAPVTRRSENYMPPQSDVNWAHQPGYDAPSGGQGYPMAVPGGQARRKGELAPGTKSPTGLDDGNSGGSGRKESPPGGSSSPLSSSQTLKYNTLEDVEGRIFAIAKDQHGCRFLQRKFDEGGDTDVAKIFDEIRVHIIELMTDPFGNYLIQKLLEVCSSEQRMDILKQVTERSDLISISLNMHGTRAVQKLIETIEGTLQTKMVIAALRPGVVALIKDLNGNHVVQRCLQKLTNADSQFIFDAAANHCIEIATHRHGCCVLQRCIDYSTGGQRERLVREIAANALVLGQDPFGNYVVQYILDLNLDWAAVEVMDRLQGQYAVLAQQKFSSNVVEKCLKLAGEDHRTIIIEEIINSPRFSQLLQDPFANYVFQSALTVSKGSLHNALVEAIRPHTQILKSSPYGKRILSRINSRK